MQADGINILISLLREQEKTDREKMPDYSQADWHGLCVQAVRHGIAGLLHHRLKEKELMAGVPADCAEKLRNSFFATFAKNIHIYQELLRVVELLQQEGIPVILLKGIHLAECIYGHLGLRPMSDIDLLIPPDYIHQAIESMFRNGFKPFHAKDRPYFVKAETGHFQIPANKKHFADIHHPERRIKVDLHASIVRENDPFDIDLSGLWQRSIRCNIQGREFRVLAPEDLVLHLCIHGSCVHLFRFGLLPFCDIAQVITRYRDSMNWQELADRAVLWRAQKPVFLLLSLIQPWFNSPIPQKILAALEPADFDPRYFDIVKKQVYADAFSRTLINPFFRRLWGHKSLFAKTKLLQQRIFLPRRLMAQIYSLDPASWKTTFYYVVRIKDLLFRYAQSAYKLIRGDKNLTTQAVTENTLMEWLGLDMPVEE